MARAATTRAELRAGEGRVVRVDGLGMGHLRRGSWWVDIVAGTVQHGGVISDGGMMSRRTRSLVGIVLAALAVVAVTAPAAAAVRMRDAVTRTKDLDVAADTAASGRLRCPSGHRVLAGGAYWYEPGQDLNASTIYERTLGASIPIEAGRGWFVSGMNYSSDAARLRIVIVCLPGTWTYVTVTTWFQPSSIGEAGGWVSCPDDHRIVTGGAA
jgi:hypothetical protein